MRLSVGILFCLLLPSLVPGQSCFDADETIWQNTWRSCEKSLSPVADYGPSHWIMYDFSEIRNLSKSWIWNTNDPLRLDEGFRDVMIDYSVDGVNWSHWGAFYFPKAKGKAVYGGFPGPDLNGISAQFILLTAMSNHGDEHCMGIAEIKFNLLPGFESSIVSDINTEPHAKSSLSVYPNPAKDYCLLSGLDTQKDIAYRIISPMGIPVAQGIVAGNSNRIALPALPDGIYYLLIEQAIIKLAVNQN